MYNGNCALKLDSPAKKANGNFPIQPSVVEAWIEKHRDAKIVPFKMGDGDYVTGVCWPG